MDGIKKYFYDTEFIEGKQDRKILGVKIGETPHTIDLISIGVISDEGKKYYAISKDFNLNFAWKDLWVRENVLRPIYTELYLKDFPEVTVGAFSKKNLRELISEHGKTNKEIAIDLLEFIKDPKGSIKNNIEFETEEDYINCLTNSAPKNKIELYGYYSAYDHVVLSTLFGKMIDLPKGFPMYTKDLKQMLDQKINEIGWRKIKRIGGIKKPKRKYSFKHKRDIILNHKDFPKNKKDHNALEDAKWNMRFYNFIEKTLK